MNIAFFSDNFYPELSGISDSIIHTGSELARRGHRVTYFVPSYSIANYQRGNVPFSELSLGGNIHIHRMVAVPYPAPTLQGRAALPNLFRGAFGKAHDLIGRKFDVIHTQSFFGAGLDALSFAKMTGTSLVGTNHTLIESFMAYAPIKAPWFQRATIGYMMWYYNSCNYVTTPSDFLATNMEHKGLHRPHQALSNPIEDGFFTPRLSKAELKKGLNLGDFSVLYAGRLSAEKNVDTLLEAFIPFSRENPHSSLVLIGQGSLRDALMKKVIENNLGQQIKIVGPFLGANKQKLYDYFHASDIFVMPSTSETQSMGTIQGFAAGLPAVVARSGALPGLVTQNSKEIRGITFTPGDAVSLTTILTNISKDRALQETYSQEAQKFAHDYKTTSIADSWERIYTMVINHGTKN